MKCNHFFLSAAVLLSILSCKMRSGNDMAIRQGVQGRVTLTEGNRMPGPDQQPIKPHGVQREIAIYNVTTASSLEGEGPLYTAVHAKLMATVKTDSAGFYRCSLKPGRYSVFTREENRYFFSGLSSTGGEIGMIEVDRNKVITYDIDINYKAVY